ncbi:MAG: hypothetical protein AVDCRST_MAG56-2750, partial [uncultured Cytophagales bacterium]
VYHNGYAPEDRAFYRRHDPDRLRHGGLRGRHRAAHAPAMAPDDFQRAPARHPAAQKRKYVLGRRVLRHDLDADGHRHRAAVAAGGGGPAAPVGQTLLGEPVAGLGGVQRARQPGGPLPVRLPQRARKRPRQGRLEPGLPAPGPHADRHRLAGGAGRAQSGGL